MQKADGFGKVVPYDEVVAQRLAELPVGPKPSAVACPFCGADIGVECTTKAGYGARTHASRWRAIGVSEPSHDDLDRDYWDREHLRLESRKALYCRPSWLTTDGAVRLENQS